MATLLLQYLLHRDKRTAKYEKRRLFEEKRKKYSFHSYTINEDKLLFDSYITDVAFRL